MTTSFGICITSLSRTFLGRGSDGTMSLRRNATICSSFLRFGTWNTFKLLVQNILLFLTCYESCASREGISGLKNATRRCTLYGPMSCAIRIGSGWIKREWAGERAHIIDGVVWDQEDMTIIRAHHPIWIPEPFWHQMIDQVFIFIFMWWLYSLFFINT